MLDKEKLLVGIAQQAKERYKRYLAKAQRRAQVLKAILPRHPRRVYGSCPRRRHGFLNAAPKIAEIPVRLLECEAEREELLHLANRQCKRQPFAVKRDNLGIVGRKRFL